MKTKLGIIAAMLLAVCQLHAQSKVDYYVSTLTLSGNSINATTNATQNATLVLTKHDIAALQIVVTGSAAGQAGNVTAQFGASLDGVTYDGGYETIVVATSGNTTVNNVGEIDIGAVGYLRLQAINNESNGTITPVIRVATKPKRNGNN
jgi:hypothetical protein